MPEQTQDSPKAPEIERFDFEGCERYRIHSDGEWVRYSDHFQALLRAWNAIEGECDRAREQAVSALLSDEVVEAALNAFVEPPYDGGPVAAVRRILQAVIEQIEGSK